MFYVVIEVDNLHSEEAPKDHAKIVKFSYQFVNAETLETVLEENKHVTLENEIKLQEAVSRLDEDITKSIGNEDFVICSLNSTWHFRVTIPRQARDEVFILPPHLQHPKVFDLWKEYDRWCVNHPETLALRTGSVVANKRTKDIGELRRVLELDQRESDAEAETVAEAEPTTSDVYSAKSIDQLSQTLETLLQLHKKCVTAEDKAMVLTHPYDSHLDVRNFLQERSKVLYMNNLPPDTTQSELESWFTQFGARPIGFWTVKNIVEETSNVNNNWSSNNSTYVEAQDSISGFVVFQCHEDATEALALNGRSILSNIANTKQPRVIEHIVEIQPSSARVLDRAQEILSPFPQSKNKPRPGDWSCPSCGFSNFQRRTACFRCSFPATSALANNKNAYMKTTNPAQSQMQHTANAYKTRPGTPAQQLPQFQHAQFQQQQHRMRFTQGQRYPQNPQQQNGSNVPFRAGDWKCPNCTYHNFAKNIVCLRCGGPKSGDTRNKDTNTGNSLGDIQGMGSELGVSLGPNNFSESEW